MNKLKKTMTVFTVVVCLLLCSFLVVGCGNSDGNENQDPPATHTHEWSNAYTNGGDTHYQICVGCDDKKYGDHAYNSIGYCICGKAKPAETPPDEPHTHEWSNSYINGGDTHYQICVGCDDKKFGDHAYNSIGYCICGKAKPAETPPDEPHTHEWLAEWTANSTHHWHKCSGCGEKTEYAVHNFSDDTCTVCGREKYSQGLEYTLSDDGESYIVTGLGTCTDTDIVIPALYNDKPVTSIGCYAFHECENLTNVTIPEGVTSIENYAFCECRSLTSITIPEGVTSIGNCAFMVCSSLISVMLPQSVMSIGGNAFAACHSLTTIDIPDGVVSIGIGAFMACSSLTSVTIPEGVTCIGDYLFNTCRKLKSITISSNITSIGKAAAYNCNSLTVINFTGTVSQWQSVSIESGWDSATGYYTVYCTDGEVAKDGNVTTYE